MKNFSMSPVNNLNNKKNEEYLNNVVPDNLVSKIIDTSYDKRNKIRRMSMELNVNTQIPVKDQRKESISTTSFE